MSVDSASHRLSRRTPVDARSAQPPDESCFTLPEKILQFGTGAFLRGFSNVYVDRAIRDGHFDGRIVVVGSTGSGRTDLINEQDGLYTVWEQGIENGETIDRCTVIGSVSRAIASTENWASVLEVARRPELEFVISNTTEVGIRLDGSDRPDRIPPASFPGKLTAFLHERARAFDFDPGRGLTVLCCELIENNSDKLRSIVLELADRWELGDAFSEWIRTHNRFCNTLVDRIVAGHPDEASMRTIEKRLGFSDELLVQAEPFSFWAIQGDARLEKQLRFLRDGCGVVVTPDISPYRTRKVRILNGAHTTMVPLSFLCGKDTVAEAMDDPLTGAFVRSIIRQEIAPHLDVPDAEIFGEQVLDRFANPFAQHGLLQIALQQTSKLGVRVVPSIWAYVERTGRLPEGLTLGFAAYLQFVSGEGRSAGVELPPDERAEIVRAYWYKFGSEDLDSFVQAVCRDPELWTRPLDGLPGFVGRVAHRLRAIRESGARRALEATLHSTDSSSHDSTVHPNPSLR